jgi:glycosyltransferase involved in cell wall biosynthesis
LAADHVVHLLSFERAAHLADADRVAAMRERIERSGIAWHPRRYHKRLSLLATLWDIAIGTIAGRRLVRRHGLGIVHARSYVPGAMTLLVKRSTGAKFVFDMRGFWVDERVDGGLWKRNGVLYRAGKWVERRLLLAADHVVSLTHAGVRVMQGFDYLQGRLPPITVIPTCADLERFRPLPKPDPDAPFTLGYVGSAGTWYLFDAAVSAFKTVRQSRPDARFLIVNKGAHAYIRERLAAGGVPMDSVELCEATHAEIPGLMARMDAGVFFYKPSFSRAACAPTKLGEFLGCGIPCLSNAGVGDMADILRKGNCGVAVDAFDETSVHNGVERLLALTADEDVGRRCVEAARLHFSLDEGVRRYREVYESLGASP